MSNADLRRTRRAARNLVVKASFIAVVPVLLAMHPSACVEAMLRFAGAVTCATTSACTSASNTASGPAVAGTSAKGIAITGSGTSGVSGVGSSGYGASGKSGSSYGGLGQSSTNAGLYGSTASSAGVAGTSSSGYGVHAVSAAGSGLQGLTSSPKSGTAGVFGVSNASAATSVGVSGSASAGTGVWGDSPYAAGATGSSAYANAMGASSVHGSGMVAKSGSGTGISAVSTNSTAVYAENDSESGASVAIAGNAAYGGTLSLHGSGSNFFAVDDNGSFGYTGNGYRIYPDGNGRTIKAYRARFTSPVVEDTGTAQLSAGSATVLLDPVFAASIDTSGVYRVFLTSDGNTRGLFVAAKLARGFVVREAQGGRSTVSFDYRIVAVGRGEAGQRMTFVAPASLQRWSHVAAPNAATEHKPG